MGQAPASSYDSRWSENQDERSNDNVCRGDNPEHCVVADPPRGHANGDRAGNRPEAGEQDQIPAGARHLVETQVIIGLRSVDRIQRVRKTAEHENTDHGRVPVDRA